MNNIEKALELAQNAINELDNNVAFELRTVICLKNFNFWWNLERCERNKAGSIFKEKVLSDEIPNVKFLTKSSDGHIWYMKRE